MPGPLSLIYPQGLVVALVLAWLYARRLRNKNSGSVVRARGQVAVQAGYPKRASHLLGR